MQDPQFWWQKNTVQEFILKPFAWVYGSVAAKKMQRNDIPEVNAPVLCIGNFTLGGAGKTPVAISLAKAALTMGLRPGIVTRGHARVVKDSEKKSVHIVDLVKDSAVNVGDEPLLLAKYCPVAVCQDRYLAARALIKLGCDIILMDDGFQSRRLFPDLSLLVVDALRGIGNGTVFPAGPLRAPLKTQLAYTDKVLIIGQYAQDFDQAIFSSLKNTQIFSASLLPTSSKPLSDRPVFAFVGIGNPHKFFASVKQLGGIIKAQHIFPDHHFFKKIELENIAREAKEKKLVLVTTAKDYMRLKDQEFQEILQNLIIVDVDVDYQENGFCENILTETVEKFHAKSKAKATQN